MSTEVKIIGGIMVACLLIIVGALFFFSKPSTVSSEAALNVSSLIKSDSPTIGQGTKVTIVEFGDFQCPACGAAAPYLESITKAYPKEVKLVFRHFPLTQHQNAIPAAKAVEAAYKQGKFWQMYQKLYENQTEWSELSDPQPFFEKLATQIGLSLDTFKADENNASVQQKINRDLQEGATLGINSTPTIFINGKKFQGPFSDLQSAVKQEMK